jgi:hypothetical protein
MAAAPDRERGVLRSFPACDIANSNVAGQAGCGGSKHHARPLCFRGAPGAREREENICPSLDIEIVSILKKFKRKIDKARKNIALPLA